MAEQKHSVMYTDTAMPMPGPYRWHLMNDWQGRIYFSLCASLCDLQDRLLGFSLWFFFLEQTVIVSTLKTYLCTTSKTGIYAMGVSIFCPKRDICCRQESLALLVAGSFPAAWFTLAGLLCLGVHPSYYAAAHSKQLTCASVTPYCKISRARFFRP